MNKTIAVLGVTGSVGTQAMDVAASRGYSVDFISANENVKLAEKYAREFHTRAVAMASERAANELKTALRSFLFNTFTRYFSSIEQTTESMPPWLEQMCDKIKRDGNFALGSEYFFSLTDKSREHVSRSLKKHTGMTVSEYINSLRLNFIANMLRNSNYSIAQIIFDSGFNNISWATECFKQKYGATMREYRQKTLG